MILYGYYRSSASYRIRIVLNLKGIEWEYRPVLLSRDEHMAQEFHRINPMGFVPVLDDDGTTLAQSPAIAEYLEEKYSTPALLPEDPIDRARVREMLNTIGCDIHPLQNLRVLKFLRAEYEQDDVGVASWCGDSLTLADVWLLPQVYNADRFGLDLAPYPTIRSTAAHCLDLPPVRDAHPSRQPDAPDE